MLSSSITGNTSYEIVRDLKPIRCSPKCSCITLYDLAKIQSLEDSFTLLLLLLFCLSLEGLFKDSALLRVLDLLSDLGQSCNPVVD